MTVLHCVAVPVLCGLSKDVCVSSFRHLILLILLSLLRQLRLEAFLPVPSCHLRHKPKPYTADRRSSLRGFALVMWGAGHQCTNV